jgi:hypothetical protein
MSVSFGEEETMLQGWARATADHWKEHRPRMYQELVESGELEARAKQAVELTRDALAEAIAHGMKYDQAWPAVREMWMYLPAEEDVPNLGEDPDSQPDPSNLASIMGSPKPTK